MSDPTSWRLTAAVAAPSTLYIAMVVEALMA